MLVPQTKNMKPCHPLHHYCCFTQCAQLTVPSNITLLKTDLKLTVIASQLITSYSKVKPFVVFIVHVFFLLLYNEWMLLFTTVNNRFWVIEPVDQLTAPVKMAIFRSSQTKEKSQSALHQLYRGSNNKTLVRISGQADSPETSICKWLAAPHALIGQEHNSV